MEFCDKCRYSFNITRDVKSKQIGGKINIKLNTLFEKISANEELSESVIEGITHNDVEGDERFESMNKKNQDKVKRQLKNISKTFFTEEIDKKNTNDDAYYICKKCKNYKEIPPGKIIYSKTYNSSSSTESHDYTLDANDSTLPLTRNYICKNSKCKTHTDSSKKEAALTRNNKYQIIYICRECQTYWISST